MFRDGCCSGADLADSYIETDMVPKEPYENRVQTKQNQIQLELRTKLRTGICWQFLVWICGLDTKTNDTQNEKEKQTGNNNKIDTSIEEDPFWSKWTSLAAVVTLAACGAVGAFFNKYD